MTDHEIDSSTIFFRPLKSRSLHCSLANCNDFSAIPESRIFILMRQHWLVMVGVATCISINLFAQKPALEPGLGHTTLNLWPGGAPGAGATPGPEVDTTTAKDNRIAGKPVIRLGNVST